MRPHAGARALFWALACAMLVAASPAGAQRLAEQKGQPAAKTTGSKPAEQPPAGAAPGAAAKPAEPQKFDIDEFEVQGADALPQIELEEAIYPFLGPNRSPEDVEKARAALEKAYQAKGLQTVSVSVPPQNVERRVVVLKVAEAKVGRLRIKGSRYFDQEKIKAKAPSLEEGKLPDFDDVTKDITALNTWPDRRVTPALRAGAKPGTVDVDLNVEDTLPFHGSVELNNRQTANTKPLRLTATARYENLWQLGHSLTLTGTVSPERTKDARSILATYLARVPDNDRLSFLFTALKSEGEIEIGGAKLEAAPISNSPTAQLGARAVVTLPTRESFFHTFNVGFDYKESDRTLTIGPQVIASPIHYWVAAGAYNATYQGEKGLTQVSADLTLGLRGLGDKEGFELNRIGAREFARENFVVLAGDLSHTRQLPKEFELFAKVQAQWADQPIVSSEQFGLGGLDSVRGYLESEAVSDNGVAGTFELRTPNLAKLFGGSPEEKGPAEPQAANKPDGAEKARRITLNELRFFGFVDGGYGTLNDPLPQERDQFGVWSVGAGVNVKALDYLNGSVVLALPMLPEADTTQRYDPRLLFRFWGEL